MFLHYFPLFQFSILQSGIGELYCKCRVQVRHATQNTVDTTMSNAQMIAAYSNIGKLEGKIESSRAKLANAKINNKPANVTYYTQKVAKLEAEKLEAEVAFYETYDMDHSEVNISELFQTA